MSVKVSKKNYSKYPELNERRWLEKKYLEEELNTVEISNLIGCDRATVVYHLDNLKIPRRTRLEAIREQYPKLNDKKYLERKYLEERLNTIEIGELVGCSPTSVSNSLNRLNIPRRAIRDPIVRFKKLLDKKWLESEYVNNYLSCAKISELVGCSPCAVNVALKRLGIPLRAPFETQHKYIKEEDYVLLKRMYVDEKKSAKSIGSRFGCSPTCIRNTLKRNGIHIRSLSEGIDRDREYPELTDKEWLQNKYWIEKLSSREIGAILGCDNSTVLRNLGKHSIPRRTVLEAKREKVKKEKGLGYRTNIELKLESIFKKHLDCIEYTGNSSFIIRTSGGNLNPDFVIKDKKIAIEANGDFWHSPLLNRNLRKGAVVTYRKKYLEDVGWQLIVFWETDILRKDAEAFVLSVLRKEGMV